MWNSYKFKCGLHILDSMLVYAIINKYEQTTWSQILHNS